MYTSETWHITPFTPHLEDLSHPNTKTKLAINLMLSLTILTLLTLLILLNPTNPIPNRNSKMIKLTFFGRTSPQKPSRQCCIFKQTASRTITDHRPALGLTDFPTSCFLLIRRVPEVEWVKWLPVNSSHHQLVTWDELTVWRVDDLTSLTRHPTYCTSCTTCDSSL